MTAASSSDTDNAVLRIVRLCRGTLKLTLFFVHTLLCAGLQSLILIFARKQKNVCRLPRLWHAGACRIFGIRTLIKGSPCKDDNILYVSNHLSYLDIPVIGRILTCYFVAKKEVSGWPGFGFLAKTQKTLFIERSAAGLKEAGEKIEKHVKKGENLVVFPEGTSTDGQDVLPFKSSLFNFTMISDSPIHIQPFTIRLRSVNGQPVESQELRDLYAWHGDMELLPHLWAFACSKGAEVELTFHPLTDVKKYSDRKSLSKAAYQMVAAQLGNSEHKTS